MRTNKYNYSGNFTPITIVTTILLLISFSAGSWQSPLKAQDITEAGATASYENQTRFNTSYSSEDGAVYEVLPGKAVMNPSMEGTPFSDSLNFTEGSYEFTVINATEGDSPTSQDSIHSVNILFTGNDGRKYKIDSIDIIHKADTAGDHTFFGGVGQNEMMHGNTGIGNSLMPKLLSYITLWGKTDLKDAETDTVVASDRLIHIMTTTKVRDENLEMIPSAEVDSSNYNIRKAQTHVILPPENTKGEMSPVPGTDHGFLHMMFENVHLENANRDWKMAYEVLPGPAAINPNTSPTPFSDRLGLAAGSFSLDVVDLNDTDSPDSRDSVKSVDIRFERINGETFSIDSIDIIHKPDTVGHTFFGGVGFNKTMHGNTGIGTGLMPKLKSYITLWGITDLKDGNGNVLAEDRLIHIMVSTRTRNENLELITNTQEDQTNHSEELAHTHVILPPKDTKENPDPVPNTGHGFLHMMYERTSVDDKIFTDIDDEIVQAAPEKFRLQSNYPNPFNPTTTIPFTVPERANVTVEVYNMLGKRITTLVDDKAYSAGHHTLRFDGTGLASGVYLYKFKADGASGKTFSSTKRLTIIK